MAKYIIKGLRRGKWFYGKGQGSTDDPRCAHPYTERELRRYWSYWGFSQRDGKPTLRQVEDS